MTASPLRIRLPVKGTDRGMFLKTLALGVMTSPISPFPLVTAFRRVPPL